MKSSEADLLIVALLKFTFLLILLRLQWPCSKPLIRYSIDGYLESLPNLGNKPITHPERKVYNVVQFSKGLWLIGHAHGCGSYTDSEGRKVYQYINIEPHSHLPVFVLPCFSGAHGLW